MKPTAREIALSVLTRVEEGQAYVNLALQEALGSSSLDVRDRNLCTELVYGTVQRQRPLDLVISAHSSQPVDKLQSIVRVLLRLTLYQLVYLERVPAYAAVNEAVQLAKRKVPRAAGFVNAVLRAVMRAGSPSQVLQRLIDRMPSEVDRLATQLSVPSWLMHKLIHQYGEERAVAILAAQNRRAPISLRVNRRKSDRDALVVELAEQLGMGMVEPSVLSESGIRITGSLDIAEFNPFREGKVSVQDEAAMLVAPLLNAQPGERILDVCAAPGGKTTHVAEWMDDAGQIDAWDVHLHKMILLKSAAARLGLESIRPRLCDGRTEPVADDFLYDAVLVDAPCTGFGVLRHRPDIRWRRKASDVTALSALQRELLVASAKRVRKGGRLVYCTCTLLKEENEQVIVNFLASRPDFHLLPPTESDISASVLSEIRVDTGVQVTPEMFSTDGFYISRLQRSLS